MLFEEVQEESQADSLAPERAAHFRKQADQELSILLASLLATRKFPRKSLGVSWKQSPGSMGLLAPGSPRHGSPPTPSALAM